MTSLRSKLLLTAILVSVSGTAQAQFPALPGEFETIIGELEPTERFIIRYKDNTKSKTINEVMRGKGELMTEADGLNMVAAVMPKNFAMSLKGHPNIESIEVDPRRYLMSEETPYGIPMVQADQISDAGTGNQKVCIMDTGYDRQHVDLQAVRVTGNNNNRTGPWAPRRRRTRNPCGRNHCGPWRK